MNNPASASSPSGAPVALVLQMANSSAGRVGAHLDKLGRRTVEVRPLEGEPLPAPESLGGVVVFGGPMSANDEAELDGIRAQLDWIPRVTAAGIPFLGICLGGQLLAKSMGAAVAPHPAGLRQIGYTSVTPTAVGAAAGFLDAPHRFYQWHSEGFMLPKGAELLAECPVFPHQAFRLDGRTCGLQFHPEVTDEMMETWLKEAAAQLDMPGAQLPETQRRLADEWRSRIDSWTLGLVKRLFG